jgi:hypothetical protein
MSALLGGMRFGGFALFTYPLLCGIEGGSRPQSPRVLGSEVQQPASTSSTNRSTFCIEGTACRNELIDEHWSAVAIVQRPLVVEDNPVRARQLGTSSSPSRSLSQAAITNI